MTDLILKIESPLIKTELTSIGWNLPKEINEDDWQQAGNFLVKVDQARQWWLGDWWNACKWGDGKKACEEIGVDYQTAQDCGMVARKFQISSRNENLSFSHHKALCPIEEPAMQDKLLDWCLSGDKRKTVRELREKVQNYLTMKDWAESEKERRFDVEAGKTVVSNMKTDVNLINWAKTEGLFIQIDRGSPFGNPFEIPGDGDRKTVCESYETYFGLKKSLHRKIKSLQGKVLGCWCYPEQCHGDYLAELANGTFTEEMENANG